MNKYSKSATYVVTAVAVAVSGIGAAIPATAANIANVANVAAPASISRLTASTNNNRNFNLRNAPRVAGNMAVGSTVEAAGRWDSFSPRPDDFRYQWFRGNWPIPGATNRTYYLRAADEGREISVRVTAIRPGFNNRNFRSAARVVQPRGTQAPTPTTPAVPSTPRPTPSPQAPNAVITRAQAEAIALAFIGSGRVTWAERENDYGAAWEIEITLPDRREVDVYVSANGTVVNTNPRSWMNR